MTAELAASITKAASKQTFYTIRFLVDGDRVDDAYRAYGYFRWVDDVLDAGSVPVLSDIDATGRRAFLERQKSLLDRCYRGESTQDATAHERMLVDLVKHDNERNSGLQAYLRNMMLVMEFDVRRRGGLVSDTELTEYTRWLAIAVTEAVHYFIGHDGYAPRDQTRYLAVIAAHIAHMLRDTFDDARAGYTNIPREVLASNGIGPLDVTSDAYRAWVRSRVLLARDYFAAGKDYFARAESARCRLAGNAYIARFEWLLDTIEQEGYVLRPEYAERKSASTGLKMGAMALSALIGSREGDRLRQPVVPHPMGKL